MTVEPVMGEAVMTVVMAAVMVAAKAEEEARAAVVAKEAVVAGPFPVGKAATTARVEAEACRCTRCKCCSWPGSSCPS